jgi:hypothetical protein
VDCYLNDKLSFPFAARCATERPISPLQKGDEVEVIGMAPEQECEREMFVTIRWEKKTLAIPFSQLKPHRSTDEATAEAVADWLYWVQQGYQF